MAPAGAGAAERSTPPALERHLAAWLGAWPPGDGRLEVVGSARRTEPGWDGRMRSFVGIVAPHGGILSVRPEAVRRVRALATSPAETEDPRWRDRLVETLGLQGQVIGRDVFRFLREAPSVEEVPELGRWLPAGAPDLPGWLAPFNAPEVLVAYDDDGEQLGALGIKLITPHGGEIATVVEPHARGRGLARSLAAQASRRLLADGQIPTTIHGVDNVGSVRAAGAIGFRDEGWWALELLPHEARWRRTGRKVRRRMTARRDRGGRRARR